MSPVSCVLEDIICLRHIKIIIVVDHTDTDTDTDTHTHTHTHLDGGEDAGEGSGEEQEDRDGRQLSGVSVAVVSGGLEQLRRENRFVYASLNASEVGGSLGR